jgi:hypothetical protein
MPTSLVTAPTGRSISTFAPLPPLGCCKNCRWWNDMMSVNSKHIKMLATYIVHDDRTVIGGQCQRYAPSAIGFWVTRENDCCGDFDQKAN